MFEPDPLPAIQLVNSPMKEFLTSLMTARDEIRNRFSDTALRLFKDLEITLQAGGLPTDKRTSYQEARDAVLRQLHTESAAF